MDLENRKRAIEKIQSRVDKKYNTRFYFLNGQLFKVLKVDRSANTCYLYNLETKENKMFLYSDFKKFRNNAYRMNRVSKMLNRHPDRIRRAIWEGKVAKPLLIKNKTSGGKYWFTEDDIRELRDYFATVHRGRPRKDGVVVTHNVPAKEELEAMLGHREMLYVKNKNGEFVPVWKAEEF